jgi:hypothetical protein
VIDRKALRVCSLVFLAMMAATLWRLSLPSDWSGLPPNGPGSSQTFNSFWLLVTPLGLLLVIVVLASRKWLVAGPDENVHSWQHWNGMLLVPFAAIAALQQTFAIVHSLGLAAGVERMAVTHGMQVLTGGLLVMLGNAMPKMPWLSVRLKALHLEPWQWTRHMRLMGKLVVFLGVFSAIGTFLLPPDWFRTVQCSMALAVVATSILYRIKLRREPLAP